MCICRSGFSGPLCSIVSNLSNANHDKLNVNGQSRVLVEVAKTTHSPADYYEALTATNHKSSCANGTCQNGGTCRDGGKCECLATYGGDMCQVALTCSPNPCQNDQPCVEINGVARCFCTADFVEPYCHTKP